jgi:hypothetical protein
LQKDICIVTRTKEGIKKLKHKKEKKDKKKHNHSQLIMKNIGHT